MSPHTNVSINQSISQSVSQSVSQSINQSINQSHIHPIQEYTMCNVQIYAITKENNELTEP